MPKRERIERTRMAKVAALEGQVMRLSAVPHEGPAPAWQPIVQAGAQEQPVARAPGPDWFLPALVLAGLWFWSKYKKRK